MEQKEHPFLADAIRAARLSLVGTSWSLNPSMETFWQSPQRDMSDAVGRDCPMARLDT
jgi:hypothetical protein